MSVCTIHTGWPKIKDEDHFPILKVWGLRHNWDMCNAFVFDGRHGDKAYIKVERSTNVVIFFIGRSRNTLFSGVFILPIGNSACSTTHVVSEWLYSIVILIVWSVFTHIINIITCFYQREGERGPNTTKCWESPTVSRQV